MTEVDNIEGPVAYSLQRTLKTPSHISSLEFGHSGHLFAGSDDGSLRIYDLSSFKVLKAIRGLGSEVSSIVCYKRPGTEFRDVWLASGRRVYSFQMAAEKLIQTAADASDVLEIGEDDEDVLNELALNNNKTHLAYSSDSGSVGVVDLSNKVVSRMKTKHASVCGTVNFIPDRPREIVSGGYDHALLHFDFMNGTLLSRRDLPAYASVGGMTLSPPFVTSTAVSPTGVIVAGTADGRLYIGFGGEKRPAALKKKRRKWEGLNEDEELFEKFAEGPIIAMAFIRENTLASSTLLGVITQYQFVRDEQEDSVRLITLWSKTAESIEKVNALVADDKRIIIGGLAKDGRGVIEVWNKEPNRTSRDT